jgi:hypothetical protein
MVSAVAALTLWQSQQPYFSWSAIGSHIADNKIKRQTSGLFLATLFKREKNPPGTPQKTIPQISMARITPQSLIRKME